MVGKKNGPLVAYIFDQLQIRLNFQKISVATEATLLAVYSFSCQIAGFQGDCGCGVWQVEGYCGVM